MPHLQVEWREAKTLRLRLEHRGMGGGKPSPLRLLFFAHPADYRAVLQGLQRAISLATSSRSSPAGRTKGRSGTITSSDHPEFAEMARQNVRFTWTSFWFTHLGEYLPAEPEWYPVHLCQMVEARQPMTDAKIRAFIREMHEQRIGVFAYFNVTEYGGAGARAATRRPPPACCASSSPMP